MESWTVYCNVTYFETSFLSSMSIIDQGARNEVHITFFSKGGFVSYLKMLYGVDRN